MSYQGKLKRYLLILEHLKRQPSFSDLKDHLADYGFELGPRTLQRDIEGIRDELGIEVAYDRPSNSYAISGGHEELNGVMQLLERAQLMELLNGDEQGLRELRRCLRFEELGRLRGLHLLAPLLNAIRERREVSVSYKKFHEQGEKQYSMRPHLLKEYRGRWYLLGRSAGHARPIALGLDRISGMKVSHARFERTNEDVAAFYDHVIGVDAAPGKPERIVLRFGPVQAEYVKALPLHPSQHVEQDDKEGTVISLYVMPNIELRQTLMGLGADVLVLEPKRLAKEISVAHKKAAARYEG